jgi:hypothetical protein
MKIARDARTGKRLALLNGRWQPLPTEKQPEAERPRRSRHQLERELRGAKGGRACQIQPRTGHW